jgi:sucrose phosphorylase
MQYLAETIVARGGNVNRILSDSHADGLDVHQLNCTYYSALGEDDDRYVAARAIQLFAPGSPQVYYVGLLAGANDHVAVARTGEGRAINRHDFTRAEILAAVERPVVRRVLDLIRLRAMHPAFDGRLEVTTTGRAALRLTWTTGPASCRLDVDLASGRCEVAG